MSIFAIIHSNAIVADPAWAERVALAAVLAHQELISDRANDDDPAAIAARTLLADALSRSSS